MVENKEKIRTKKELLAKVQTLVAKGVSLALDDKSGAEFFKAAIHEIDSFIKLPDYKRDTDLLILKANVLETFNRHSRAASLYKKVLKIEPKNIRAHIDLGEYYKFKANNIKARNYFDKALGLLKNLSDKERTKEDFKDMEQVYQNIVDLLISERKIEKAIDVIDEGMVEVKQSKLLKEIKRELLSKMGQ